MDIIEKIRDIDCHLKSVTASRPPLISEGVLKRVEMKRDVSHEVSFPRRKSDSFSVVVKDRITFTPHEGPFQIEIVIRASVSLADALPPGEIKKLVGEKNNILSIINQCLPHSSAVIAYITDKMGFSPVIFSSRITLDNQEHGNASRISS